MRPQAQGQVRAQQLVEELATMQREMKEREAIMISSNQQLSRELQTYQVRAFVAAER